MISLDSRENLKKKRPDFFQVAIRFHPDHPWPKALIYSLSVLAELFYTKTDHYFGFPSLQT